jgi:hypothetical protein
MHSKVHNSHLHYERRTLQVQEQHTLLKYVLNFADSICHYSHIVYRYSTSVQLCCDNELSYCYSCTLNTLIIYICIANLTTYRGAALVGSCFATPPKRSSASTGSSSSANSSSGGSDTAAAAAVAQSRPTAGYEQGAELLSKWMTAASLAIAAPCLRLVGLAQ